MKLITTSWDDGHPQDFKIATLLDKYNLQGTFYIPRSNQEHEVMREDQVQLLSKQFEIGGHTLSHIRLTRNQHSNFEHEIKGSFTWLKELLGDEPVSFCFPGGVFNADVVDYVRQAGYKIFRSTELLSVDNHFKDQIDPTSIQLFEHGKVTYLKHLLKRGKVKNLLQWILSNSETDLLKLTDNFIKIIEKKGSGCLHLWGHSWEIEEFALWNKVETVLSHLSQHRNFTFIQNKDLLR
ncbi:MAG: polysaccharide deacetylase family protein [Chitinophagaceae bacterium]